MVEGESTHLRLAPLSITSSPLPICSSPFAPFIWLAPPSALPSAHAEALRVRARVWWQRPVALVEAEEGHDELELAFRIFDADHVRRATPARAAAAAAAWLPPPSSALASFFLSPKPSDPGRMAGYRRRS